MTGNVLVTGGGFIGSQLVKALVKRGDNVVVYDAFPDLRRLKEVEAKIQIERGDLLDLAYLVQTIRSHKINKIIHTAAVGWRAGSDKQPMRTLQVNVQGSANIYEAARLTDVERVVGFCSYWVYGKTVREPVDEDHPLNPREGVYNVSKLMAEKWGLMYSNLYDLDFISVRPTSVYGPDQPPGNEPLAMLVNAIAGQPTKWPNGRDLRFDPICVFDLVNGVIAALDVNEAKLKHRVFNLGYGKDYTIGQVADIIKKLIPGAVIDVGPGLVPEWDCATGTISIKRAEEELGYKPKYDPEKGFKLCIEHAKKQG
ncbi:MAG: NAD-dependent epimerase/dehydratase family protein [Candidatus Bathyarchaeia archaeon]